MSLQILVQHFAFENSKALTHRLLTSLDGELDKQGVDIDIVHLHGSLTQEKKTGFMELFIGAVSMEGYNGYILMATAAADLGVDHRECAFVLILEWPDSISTFKQRSGRGSRNVRDSSIHRSTHDQQLVCCDH